MFISFTTYKHTLNERVEFLTEPNQTKHYFRDYNELTYAFGFIGDDLVLSKIHGTHGDAVMNPT